MKHLLSLLIVCSLLAIAGRSLPAQETQPQVESNVAETSNNAESEADNTPDKSPVAAPRPRDENSPAVTKPPQAKRPAAPFHVHRSGADEPNAVMYLLLSAAPILFFLWVGASIGVS
ncbi:MAG: hypothetical protein R3C11_09940 [Planctomycetaceae bacterium]